MGDTFKGDERAPKSAKQLRMIRQGLQKELPNIIQILGKQMLPWEQRLLQTEQNIAPKRAALESFLYGKFAPQYAETQNRLADIQSRGDLSRFLGPGRDIIRGAGDLAREQDPEYYATRAAVGGQLSNMLNSPGLTGNEMESLTRGVQRMRVNSGTGDIMGNANTAAHAMLYGNAARNRQMQNLQLAGGLMPQMQTTDINSLYGIGTGRGGNANLFAREINAGGEGGNVGQNVMNNMFGGQNTSMNINANRRSIMDYVGQAWQQSGLSSAVGGMGMGR